jgi:GPH family glycoside/pentoside/hexuronide:cation symporter
MSARQSRRRALAYGVAEVGASLSYNTINFFLLFFLVETAGLRPGLAGAVLLAGRALDAFVDPVLGRLSDTVKARQGRRSPLIFWGALPFGLSFALLWLLPDAPQGTLFWLATGVLMLHACVFTLVQTSYLALTPELAPDYEARTVLSGYRVAFATVASLLAAAAPPLLAAGVNTLAGLPTEARLGWGVMGVLFGGMMSTSYLVMVRTVREPHRPSAGAPGGFWSETGAALRAYGYGPLLLLFVTVTLALGTLSAILPFFLASYLRLPAGVQTALLALLFMTAALSVPLWTRLSQRSGKKDAFAVGLVLLGVSLPLLVLTAPPGGLSVALVVLTVVVGAGVGSVLLFPWALLPDVVERDAETHVSAEGARRDGLFYALFTLFQTAAFALSAALSGGVLELSGYDADAITQTAAAVQGVRWLVGGVAAGFFLLALLPLRRYPLP